ncbi:MAG TPA: FAD-dependent oxidoreductase, partial [Bryobacteraceae bacterium]|nr:FAD-dependent oxidoreductase [Bryobacteraceae bacterium]
MVIVVGGFGGLYAARELAGVPVSVTVIDKRNYHLFRPMLYQVATGLLSADEISGPLRSILSRQRNVEVLMDEVIGVDADKRVVRLKQRQVSYDYLILATGIQYNYFGHDEWRGVRPASNRSTTRTLFEARFYWHSSELKKSPRLITLMQKQYGSNSHSCWSAQARWG